WRVHAHGIARVEEDSDRQVQTMLNACDDEDLLRQTADTASASEVIGDGFAQGPIASRIRIGEQRACGPAKTPRGDLRPEFGRKRVDGRLGPERPRRSNLAVRRSPQSRCESRKPGGG